MNLHKLLYAIAVAGITAFTLACAPARPAQGTTSERISALDADMNYCDSQLHRTLAELADSTGTIDYTLSPRNILAGEHHWNLRRVDKAEWCGGFFPGILWYDYEATADTAILSQARRFTQPLAFLAQTPAYDHDLGFLVITSFLNGYRLTGDNAYKQVLLACADTLATLFNPHAGTILSWPRHVRDYGGHNTIMDNMINLELLFWAADNGGADSLRQIAMSHADTTMAYHFHDEGIAYHVAVYDSIDGHFIRGCTHQGLADTTMWARGQSWAIYGYTMCYRYTHEQRYLSFAQKVADAYLKNLPADGVPFWDFNDPRIATTTLTELTPSPSVAPRDASAACVVASALIELADYVAPNKAREYLRVADLTLQTLRRPEWRGADSCPAFLLHSTGHHPAGSEVDASISYADYYYIEALIRVRKHALESADKKKAEK